MASLERYRRSSVLDSSRNISPQGSSTSTTSSGRSGAGMTTNDSSELRIGMRVLVQGKVGTIRYVGTTSFQTGKWIGIELDEPSGKNSGVVQGKRYFDCRLNHGVFVRPSQVRPLPSGSASEVRKRKTRVRKRSLFTQKHTLSRTMYHRDRARAVATQIALRHHKIPVWQLLDPHNNGHHRLHLRFYHLVFRDHV